MTEAAPQTPTADIEPTISKGGSNPFSFEDMSELPPQARDRKPEPKEKPEPKAKSPAKRDASDESESADKPRSGTKPAKAKEAPEGDEDLDEGGDEKKGKEEERKAKPKVHKLRSGDAVLDVQGDSLVSVEIDGKKQDVTLEELRSNYSGKVFYDRKLSDLDRREKGHQHTVTKMNDMVNGLMERASKNPEDGLDFLAELTGKDPVEMKMSTLRAQIQELLPLAQMSDDERETWLKDRERDFRDRRYERRKEDDDKKVTEAKQKEETDALRSRYGVDEERYETARSAVKEHLGKEPTPAEIIQGERYLLGFEVVREAVPHLESHPKFANIMEDIASDLLKDPSLSREKLSKLLKEVWAEESDQGLRKIGKKAKASAEESGETFSRPESGKREAVFFDDL